MKKSTTTLLRVLTLSTALAGAWAHAQQPPHASAAEDAIAAAMAQNAADNKKAEEEAVFYVPYGNLQNANAESIERAKELGKSVTEQLMQSYQAASEDKELAETMAKVKRRADDIADTQMTAERDEVLKFLGLDPESDTNLYYFVSWSMPLEMLRSYAIEAMWSGGTLVFKGVPPGRDFGSFMAEDLSKLVYGKGASANISIDPRMFDAYEVKTVPTIVLTTYRADMQCIGVNPVSFKYRNQDLKYDTCPPLDPDKYAKMSGAVTAQFALQQFADDGVKNATTYLSALARGFALGQMPSKDQKPFAGLWQEILSPSERLAQEKGIEEARIKHEQEQAKAKAASR